MRPKFADPVFIVDLHWLMAYFNMRRVHSRSICCTQH